MITFDEFFELTLKRRSVRSYSDKEIEEEKILKIIQAGIQAPSPTNSQGWKFRILTNKEEILKLSNIVEKKIDLIKEKFEDGIFKREFLEYAKNFTFMKKASVVLLCYCQKPKSIIKSIFSSRINFYKGDGSLLSLGMNIQNMLLAATTLGVASCVLTGPLVAENEINEVFVPPRRYELAALITLGYSNKEISPPLRKPLEKFIMR